VKGWGAKGVLDLRKIRWLGDSLKVKVKAPPEKGRANEAIVALLADRLGIDPSSIAVVSGRGSPAKIVAVDGMDDETNMKMDSWLIRSVSPAA